MARIPKAPLASAISGLIVAALILMTPNEIFEAIVVQTGLPGVLDAATPPLGARARIVTAAIFAVVIGVVAWGALSVALRHRWRHAEEIEPGLPRLRRADAHPDAPPRRPIFARDDLGAPLDDAAREEGEARVARMRARFADPDPVIPDWREAVDEIPVAPEPLPDPAAYPEPAPVHEPDPEPMELGAEAIIWEPEPEPVADAPESEPELESATEPEQALECETEPEPEPEPEPRFAPDFETAVPIEPTPPPRLDPYARDTLGALVDRLELGLARRRAMAHAPMPAPANVTAHPIAARSGEDDMDGALREALDALQRLGAKRV